MEEIIQELIEQRVLVHDDVGTGLVPARIEGAHPSTTLRTGSGTPLQIPTTVQGVLAARIDRLTPDEKTLLQQLAVIGRQFPLSLVKQVIAQPEEELYRLLGVPPAQRVSLRAAGLSRGRISLQACAHAGGGLRLGPARAPQSVTRANGAGDGKLYRATAG